MGVNLAVIKVEDGFRVVITGFESEKEAKDWFFSESEGAEEVIAFIQVDSEEIEDEDIESAVDALNSLMCVDAMRDAMEYIMSMLVNFAIEGIIGKILEKNKLN